MRTVAAGLMALLLVLPNVTRAGEKGPTTKKPQPVRDVRNPYPDPYKGTAVHIEAFSKFIGGQSHGRYKGQYKKLMKLSFESSFLTYCDIVGYSKPESRSTALVKAGLAKEESGSFREALEIYQR